MTNTIKMIEYNIKGYAGFYDYDGISDDNLDVTVCFPDTMREKEVLDVYFRKYADNRVVALRVVSKKRVEYQKQS